MELAHVATKIQITFKMLSLTNGTTRSICIYMKFVSKAIIKGLRRRDVSILTVVEAGMMGIRQRAFRKGFSRRICHIHTEQ